MYEVMCYRFLFCSVQPGSSNKHIARVNFTSTQHSHSVNRKTRVTAVIYVLYQPANKPLERHQFHLFTTITVISFLAINIFYTLASNNQNVQKKLHSAQIQPNLFPLMQTVQHCSTIASSKHLYYITAVVVANYQLYCKIYFTII